MNEWKEYKLGDLAVDGRGYFVLFPKCTIFVA